MERVYYQSMRVINRNVGTPMLSHYCPNCGREVFNVDTRYDEEKNCPIKECRKCGVTLEFPNQEEIREMIGG